MFISYIPYFFYTRSFLFLFSFLFLSFDDYLYALLRHRQVYVSFLVGNKVYNR